MKIIGDSPEEYCVKGIFFKSKYFTGKSYLLSPVVKGEENCVVMVRSFGSDQDCTFDLVGQEVGIDPADLRKEFSLDIWPKYYYPTFQIEDNQWYHDYNKDNTENYILALADVMQYALDLGIKTGNITLR